MSTAPGGLQPDRREDPRRGVRGPDRDAIAGLDAGCEKRARRLEAGGGQLCEAHPELALFVLATLQSNAGKTTDPA
ncbi:hypothetical protein K2X89_10650 [Myxococcota bacterium]|nr:hypothetical protein [Myxococcota bacterium]